MKKGNRSLLYQALPLRLPYLIQIFPCYGCNLKCQYCLHALPREKHGYISHTTLLNMDTYRHLIDSAASTGEQIKMLRFAGIGEPLLHPQIVDMVAYAAERQVAESIDIVTNGVLLTPRLSQALISAGLSTLRVSLEGLSGEEYRENAGVPVDFALLCQNIQYYFEHCGDSRVYVKIIDYMLEGSPERERRFYQLFQGICHSIAIEHLTPTIKEIDYHSFAHNSHFDRTQDGETKPDTRVCPQPFYMLQCNPDGSFVPCCSTRYPLVTCGGSLPDVWRGDVWDSFRVSLLSGAKPEVCAQCNLYQYGTYPEDILDGHEEELLALYLPGSAGSGSDKNSEVT